jgi:uncharacterized membrane protein YuzA (DUF378 family)
MKLKFNKIANWLLIIGGLNWGLSLFNINLVSMLANATAPIVGQIVYGAVGISAIMALFKKK